MRKKNGLRILFLGILFALALSAAGCSVDGAEVFRKEGCLGCHRFKGVGGGICPDLTDIKNRRSDAWIIQQIKDPGINDPNSKMPSYPHMKEKEIKAVLDYLKS